MTFGLAAILAFVPWPSAFAQYPAVQLSQDRTMLLGGVYEIAAPGVPGVVLAWGDRAFPLVVGGSTQKLALPVVAAGRLGSGRIVLFGHSGYGDAPTAVIADTGQLLANAVQWAARDRPNAPGPRVGLLGSDISDVLAERRWESVRLDGTEWPEALDELDVVVCFTTRLAANEVQALRRFIREGGGLVCGGTGWGWRQLNQNRPLSECALNHIIDGSGLLLADGTLERTSESGFRVGPEWPDLCNGTHALALLEKHSADAAGIEPADLSQAGLTLTNVARSLPAADELLRPRLRRLLTERADELRPSEASPLRVSQPLPRVLLAFQIAELATAPPNLVRVHPAADDFPGAVPADAPAVSREMEFDGRVPDWHSTGLYAPPGRIVQAHVSGESARVGLAVRIGAHSDENWHHANWTRVPEITLERRLVAGTNRLVSPFGGLIYVVVPRDCKAQRLRLRIGNAVEAPRFVLGRTTAAEWQRLRNAPGPWAEFESSRIIVTVPSECVRRIDDPRGVLELWDRVSDAAADLATIPRERKRPERFVADRQISAGYMHAGYPIMTHLDVAEDMVVEERLRKGNWGLFHELGHNHQSGDWTFDGTGEVTCNLFTLYVLEQVCGVPIDQGHDGVRDPSKAIERYIRGGAKFDMWKADPFLALAMYVQLQQAFGWDLYQRVFREYRELPAAERPKSDDEKRDQWLVRVSRAAGRDLGPFFQAWGVPTSAAARESVADLPAWMPPGFPPQRGE